jgi:hypothetical protein
VDENVLPILLQSFPALHSFMMSWEKAVTDHTLFNGPINALESSPIALQER